MLDPTPLAVAVGHGLETLGVFAPFAGIAFRAMRFMAIAKVSCASAEIEP